MGFSLLLASGLWGFSISKLQGMGFSYLLASGYGTFAFPGFRVLDSIASRPQSIGFTISRPYCMGFYKFQASGYWIVAVPGPRVMILLIPGLRV